MKKMNKKILVPVISAIVIVVVVGILLIPNTEENTPETLSISYAESNKELQSLLKRMRHLSEML